MLHVASAKQPVFIGFWLFPALLVLAHPSSPGLTSLLLIVFFLPPPRLCFHLCLSVFYQEHSKLLDIIQGPIGSGYRSRNFLKEFYHCCADNCKNSSSLVWQQSQNMQATGPQTGHCLGGGVRSPSASSCSHDFQHIQDIKWQNKHKNKLLKNATFQHQSADMLSGININIMKAQIVLLFCTQLLVSSHTADNVLFPISISAIKHFTMLWLCSKDSKWQK